MVPFWVLNIIRHLVFRVPKRDQGTVAKSKPKDSSGGQSLEALF